MNPGKGSFNTTVQVVNIKPINTYPAVLFPGAVRVLLASGEPMSLASVNREKRIIEGAGHHVGGKEIIKEPLLAKLWEVAGEYTDGEWSEVIRLV